jgi:hypothetical protein
VARRAHRPVADPLVGHLLAAAAAVATGGESSPDRR